MKQFYLRGKREIRHKIPGVKDCPECLGKTKILNSRPSNPLAVCRRRECLACECRFTTYEIPEKTMKVILESQELRRKIKLFALEL